jgi:serine protease Do
VLQLDLGGKAVPVAQLGSSEALTAGQYVIAMGSPLGLARSTSAGVVSTPERYLPEDVLPSGGITGAYNTWIQTDAAINPGNSGGPLVDLRGHVVGINARAVPIFGENLGFAIPIDVVKDVAGQLIEHGKVNRSWIGVRWQHLKSLAGYFGAEERGGVLVGSLVPDGPAARAGIAAGDVVTAIDGQGVSARFEEELPRFRKRIADLPVGSRVRLAALRRGTEIAFDVVTEEHPETESQETELESWGFTARDVTPDLARRRRIKSLEGALVTGVKPAAPATVAGLDEGDVVREVDGTRVKDTKHLVEVLRELEQQRKKQVLVKVDRGSTLHVMLIEPER